MRLCSYVVVIDKGFAPERAPFSGFCTLAACTPNHQGLRLKKGDWVLGKQFGWIPGDYLFMRCTSPDVLDFDNYYRDGRFAVKKAKAGTWRKRCGDNIYYRDKANQWVRELPFTTLHPESLRQDTLAVHGSSFQTIFFISEKTRAALPPKFASLARTCQGCKYPACRKPSRGIH